MIIRTEHSFGPGKAESTIIAKWVQEAERAADASPNADLIDRDSAPAPEKCWLGGAYSRESSAKAAGK